MNILTELKRLTKPAFDKIKIGVITDIKPEGGYYVLTVTGGTEYVIGNANIGDTIIYQNEQILGKLKTEKFRTYKIG